MNACASCGCTDERACPGGCVWATPTLCSRCVLEGPHLYGPDALAACFGASERPPGFAEQFPLEQALELGGFEGMIGPTYELDELSAEQLDELERADVDSVRERADWRQW
jgi:hypothetical protein